MQYDSDADYFEARRSKQMASREDVHADGPPLPALERIQSGHPALSEEVTSVPVTPGVTDWDAFDRRQSSSDHNGASTSQSGNHVPPWAANSFHSSHSSGLPKERRPSSATEAAAGAKNGEDLLRRLSLSTGRPHGNDLAEIDPRKSHPDLKLSGHVISATFCVPHKIAYAPNADWELDARRGTSALFDSFSYLSGPESPWNHTLVGWTGEIDMARSAGGPRNGVPFNKASAPIPVDRNAKPAQPHDLTDMKVPEADRQRLERQLEHDHGGRVAPVWLWDEMSDDRVATFRDQKKWRRYGEHELFPLFHYKQNEPTDGREVRKAWTTYYRMNKAFADTIMSVYKPGDVVLIHDYHLLLLPSLLRQRLPNIYIGFFLHVPFPSSEFYRCLSRRKEILEGVLGANMIGFQAYSYSRHFSSCCTRILGFDSSQAGVDAYGAHVAVDVFPIGINAESTLKAAFESHGVDEKVQAIREQYAGKKIIVGRDRLDTVRGVAQKLQAFEIFLDRHPEWRDKVVLIQVTSPTSIEDRVEKSDKTANKISDLVARINGNYGSLSFTPVQHYPQYLSKEEYFALLRVADVGLITSVRDGMNTTALEYICAQRDNHGPLIISEFSGTAGSLGNTMHINPWDLGGTAEAINAALSMPADIKTEIHQENFDYVTRNTVQSWTKSFLRRLLTNLTKHDQSKATPALDRAQMLSRYRKASRRLFMFDYDGTLTPIVGDPEAAIPSDKVTRNLKTLSSDPRNAVWIISGRDQAFLDEWMGSISELGLSAEHGSFMRNPSSNNWMNLTESMDMEIWQAAVIKVFSQYSERTQGSFIERKKIAITWHYRRADPEYGAFQAQQCQKELEATVCREFEVEVMPGKANLEVRPRFVNKGEIAKRLIGEYGSGKGKEPDFVLCLGDDFTDEDMFRSLRASSLQAENIFACTVGASSKQTIATWHLLEPSDVISAIALLNGSTDAGNAGAVSVVDAEISDIRA
nr:hypothetical protein B0A51_12113 [Rachicladosporium sp. CCFEE 5018]